jgi:nucleotide-binding universal stress UspA family protein
LLKSVKAGDVEVQVTSTAGIGPIVVGVDGSPPSLAALRWAAGQALLQRRELHIVVAWHMPSSLGWPAPVPEDFDPAEPALTVLADGAQLVRDDYPAVTVKTHAEEGLAAQCLIGTAQALGASLLVVGARRHGEVTGLLIGSVSQYLATHAKCPVVIVHK